MDIDLSIIGWLHTLACMYALVIGGLVLWRLKGGVLHKSQGRHYVYASVLANLTALAIYKIGSFNIFHLLAILTLASLGVAFASAYWRTPRRIWLRTHLTAVIFSYYQLVGALINELFVRMPVLQHSSHMALPFIQGIAMLIFLMIIAYFWGKTSKTPSLSISTSQPYTVS